MKPTQRRRGQILPGVIALLVILSVMVPAMVYWVQRESIASANQADDTRAFHLAEAGTEKAYLILSLSTITWANLQAGTPPADFSFNKAFSDLGSGQYTVSITSGPDDEQATIISIGRSKNAVRAIQVIYTNAILGDTAIFSGRGAQISGGANVEWGAVMSPYAIDAGNRNHPQFWSAAGITTKDTSPNPPNCDAPNCCQWHSYQTNLPAEPAIDFDFYRASAAASVCNIAGATPANSCYWAGNAADWNHQTTGQTIFIEGSLTVKSPGMFHTGTMFVMGNLNLPNGVWGRGTVNMNVPNDAWKQYCNDWAFYKSEFDPANPHVSFPGLDSTDQRNGLTYNSDKISVNGFLYVGGNFNNGGGGGGNSDVYGMLYAVGSSTLNAASPVDFYYNGNVTSALQTTNVSLTRESWRHVIRGWPGGL